MIGIALLTSLWAFMMHWIKILIDFIKVDAWHDMTSYAIGVTAAEPCVEQSIIVLIDLFVHELIAYKKIIRVLIRIGYFFAFLFFGIGTTIGWLVQFLTEWGIHDN